MPNDGHFDAEFICNTVFVRSWKLTQNDYVYKIFWHTKISHCNDENPVKFNKSTAGGYTIDPNGNSKVQES
jgi:hypothetical protein